MKTRSPRPKTAPAAQNSTADWAGTPVVIAFFWAVYGVLFYLTPLASAVHQLPGTVRRGQLWGGLFLADEIVGRWFEGCSWQSLAERGVILALAAAIVAVALASGWLLLRMIRALDFFTRLETLVFSTALGLSLISLLTLCLGLAGCLNRWLFVVIGVTILALAAKDWVPGLRFKSVFAGREHDTRDRRATNDKPIKSPSDAASDFGTLRLRNAWLWLAVPFVLATVLGAILPPVDFDVREYHLQAPKEFFHAGAIRFLPHNIYANMPMGAEMLALAAMVLSDDWWIGALAGKTLIGLFTPLTALALLAAGRRVSTPTAGLIAAIAYVSIPWIAMVSMSGLIEGVFACYLFVALYALLLWRAQRDAGHGAPALLALAGWLAGAAVSCKYPAVVYVVLPLMAAAAHVAFWSDRNRAARPAWRDVATTLAIFLSAAGMACGPWFVKNAVFTGNPTYPLLSGVFDSATRTPAKNHQWNEAHSPHNFEFSDLVQRTADILVRSDWLSPWLWPLAALAAWRLRTRRLALELTLYVAFICACWWLFTHRIDRFWVPMLPVVALLAGMGAVWTDARWWRVALAVFVGSGLLFDLVVITSGTAGDARFLAPFHDLADDPLRGDPWHVYLNRHAGPDDRVLLVGDAQAFDLQSSTLYNTVFDDCLFEQLARGRSPQRVRAALQARAITYLYVAWPEIERYRSPGNYGITDFLQPQVFEELVSAGVLEPVRLDAAEQPPGQLYRVR